MSRCLALGLGAAAVGSAALLLAWDAMPGSFPVSAHLFLGATPLAAIAIAFLVFQSHVRSRRSHVVRAVILAVAFLCWAVNQLLGDGQLAVLFNDLAIGLFVVDVFLTMIGWPNDRATVEEGSSIIL